MKRRFPATALVAVLFVLAMGSCSDRTGNPGERGAASSPQANQQPSAAAGARPTLRTPAEYVSGKVAMTETKVTLHGGRNPVYWEVLGGRRYYSVARRAATEPLDVLIDGNVVEQCNGYMRQERGQAGAEEGNWVGFIPLGGGFINVAGWEHLNQSAWILLDHFKVDPSLTHVAYGVMRKGRWQNAVDGALDAAYDRTLPVLFSADGSHWAYGAKSNESWRVVLDGKPGPWHAGLDEIQFAAAAPVLAYKATHHGKSCFVVAGRAAKEFLECDSLQLSADGEHMTYRARTDAGWRAVFDSTESDAFASLGKPAVSPNGKHSAFVASSQGKTTVFHNGRPSRQIPGRSDVPIVIKNDGRVTLVIRNPNQTYQVMADEGETGPWEECSSLLLDAGGTSIAFIGLRDGKQFVVQDNQIISKQDQAKGLRFLPGGRQVAFAAKEGAIWRLHLADKTSPPRDGISEEFFVSSNGEFLFYAVFNRDKTVQACINGTTTRPFLQCGKPAFTRGRLVFYAFSEQEVYLVECRSDAHAASEAPGTAPREKAWVNSLGMTFVPVPDTKVWFSVWETRVQDYAAFVKAAPRDWAKPDFEQGPAHPAVNVTWNDANAFCFWLTEKERKEGRLAAHQRYRLPSDAEWSWAVGLPEEQGQTPQQKHAKIEGHYPWGRQLPPPKGAGNYGGASKVDDFECTSPVGSFKSNPFGLYDLGGNALEWCEDYYDGRKGDRVLRGGCWFFGVMGCFSSFRNSLPPDRVDSGIGFRPVLDSTQP